MSLLRRSSARSQSSFPLSRSKHCVYSFPPSNPVRNTWRRVSTGEDLPERTGVLQTRFFSLPNSAGYPLPPDTPEPFGPRKRVHSSAEYRKATDNSSRLIRIIVSPARKYIIQRIAQ